MDVSEAIMTRRSIRRYEPKPVPRAVLEELILTSRWSPSGSNTQPWHLHVLGGAKLDQVKKELGKCAGTPAHPDIPYPPMPEPYAGRQRSLMQAQMAFLYPPGSENTEEQKAAQRAISGRFFEAPNAIVVTVNREISPRAFLGLGMWAQTFCLAALERGLGTCIMSAAVFWPQIYRDLLRVPEGEIIAFAIAVGYPDSAARVNQFPRVREPLERNVEWWGL